MSCYEEGEILFGVSKLADELQKGVVDKPGFTDWVKRKTNELNVALAEAKPYLMESEWSRIDSAMSELAELHILAHNRRKDATEEIIRVVQLPMTMAVLKCIRR